MDKKDFEKELEQLQKPQLQKPTHMETIKLTVLNTKRSAVAGIWLVAVPCIFLFMICMKYILGIDTGLFNWIENVFVQIDRGKLSGILNPILFILLPLLGLVINLLAICHFSFDKVQRELNITVKIKWVNLAIAAISLMVIAVILTYLFTENYVVRQ